MQIKTGLKIVSIFFALQLVLDTSSFATPFKDSVRTVAIYSSKKSFFEDYPIDSLVYQLNAFNQNKKIAYYKCTEDNSKSGFGADYLVDLDLVLKKPVSEPSVLEKKDVLRPVAVKVLQANGTYKEVVQQERVTVERYSEKINKPAEAQLYIRMIEKFRNQKVQNHTISAFNETERGAEISLLLDLITFFLKQFK